MNVGRLARILGLVAEQAAGPAGRVAAGDVCAAALTAVEVTGAWLSAGSGSEAGRLMRVTNEVSGRLAELALTLGEGPSLDASAAGGPVLASDLAGVESGRRWPAYANDLRLNDVAGDIVARRLRLHPDPPSLNNGR